uniref:LIM zinc-binding domain-containing protein n=1 Tax=Acrobeloides nanus TaxID=290746 RepID=A0A914BYL6_9BILA
MFCSGPTIRTYKICEDKIDVIDDKVMIEGHDLHKKCFTCAICDTQLKLGGCAEDKLLKRQFGLMYFCPTHMLLNRDQKLDLLKKRFPVLEHLD